MNERELSKLYRDAKAEKASQRWNVDFVKIRNWDERGEALIKVLDGSDETFQAFEKKHTALEGVTWISIGIDHIDHLKQKFALGRTVALIMDRQPDVTPIGSNPNRLLHNLLYSTIPFYRPEDTASRIEDMYKRAALQGEYKDEPLSKALLAAMQYNQIDHRYLQEWKDVLDEKSTSFIPISPKEAVHGVLWVPESAKERGRPNIPELSSAWVKYGAIIEKQLPKANWAKEFNDSIVDALGTYPGRPQWESDLYNFTQMEGWKPWMSKAPRYKEELERRDRMIEYRRSLLEDARK